MYNMGYKLLQALTSHSEVQKFLRSQFSNLTVTAVSLDKNSRAKPGGQLFNRFKNVFDRLPKDQRKTCLTFHGTAEGNIQSIYAAMGMILSCVLGKHMELENILPPALVLPLVTAGEGRSCC